MITFSKSAKIFFSLAAIAMLVVLVIVYGYTTSSSNAFAHNLKKILPAAIVGGNTLFINDVEVNLQILKSLEPNVSAEFAYNSLLDRTKVKILAAELGLEWEDKLDQEKNFYISGQQQQYQNLLTTKFRNDESLFVEYVVEPAVTEAQLRTYFYSDYRINRDPYDRAARLLGEILSGGDFEDAASKHSDDKVTGQLGGDLGFFKQSELLPELENQIRKGSFGQVQKSVFVSRLGYHIIWPVETAEQNLPAGQAGGETLWHAKHILVTTSGFEAWLSEETANIKVRQLVRP